jgi:hypothetical protein
MTYSRREFSTETKRQAVRRSGGICECHLLAKAGVPGFRLDGCGVQIGIGNCFFEHIEPSYFAGRNDLDNIAAISRTCWKTKTAKYDLPKIAKVKRQQNMRFGIKSDSGPPIPGSKRSAFRKKVNGQVEWRT